MRRKEITWLGGYYFLLNSKCKEFMKVIIKIVITKYLFFVILTFDFNGFSLIHDNCTI